MLRRCKTVYGLITAKVLGRSGVGCHLTVTRRPQPQGGTAGGHQYPQHPKVGTDVHKALKSLDNINVALSLFKCSGQERGYKHSSITCAHMMRKLKEANKFLELADLVQEMFTAGFSSTTTFKCIRRSCKNSTKEATKVLVTLTTFGTPLATFSSCLNNCSYNYLLDSLLEAGRALEAYHLIRDKEKEGFNTNRKAQYIARIYEATKIQTTDQNTTAEVRLKNGSSHTRANEDSKPHRRMSEHRQVTHVAPSTVLRDYRKGGKQRKALSFISETTCRDGHCHDQSWYKYVICALAKAGNVAGVLEHFEAMKKQEPVPDMKTFLAACEALGRAGRMEEASQVHETMKEQPIDNILKDPAFREHPWFLTRRG